MATTSTLNQDIVQTKARAAAKTFLQAFVGIAGAALLLWLGAQANVVNGGGDVRDIDFNPLLGILTAGTIAGISALTSLAMNWSKPAAAPVVAEEVVRKPLLPGDEG